MPAAASAIRSGMAVDAIVDALRDVGIDVHAMTNQR
jgi:hypothetical protein